MSEGKSSFFKCEVISYGSRVKISWHFPEFDTEISQKLRELFDVDIHENSVSVLFGIFIQQLDSLKHFLYTYDALYEALEVDRGVIDHLNDIPKYAEVIKNPIKINGNEIQLQLENLGWNSNRILKWYQIRNLETIIQYPASADFSVPGAGKTTTALAFYLLKRVSDKTKLLIISPINAFGAWDEEIKECLGDDKIICRLRGSTKETQNDLNSNNQFFITNYEKVRSDLSFLTQLSEELTNDDKDYVLILDESHKMKGEQTGKYINYLSHLASKKLILTGTPMPQGDEDLFSQFIHLYPREKIYDYSILRDMFRPIFCRTTKKDINLPEPNEVIHRVPLEGAQKDCYELIVNNILKQNYDLNIVEDLRAFKRNVMRMLMFCSNPLLQLSYIEGIDSEMAFEIEKEGHGSKMERVIKDAREVCKNEKLIIWSGFPTNINRLMDHLSEFDPVSIHGRIGVGDINTPETREYNINKFKNLDKCRVFIANPAAAAEAISLHKECRNAFYLDRNYNAAHYLQSKDRIHRIGSDPDIPVNISIYQLDGTIDYNVNIRLNEKIYEMSQFLNDPSIVPNPRVMSIKDYDIDYSDISVMNAEDPTQERKSYAEKDDMDSVVEFLKKI